MPRRCPRFRWPEGSAGRETAIQAAGRGRSGAAECRRPAWCTCRSQPAHGWAALTSTWLTVQYLRRSAAAGFFQAAQQAGYRLTDDVNGYRQEGFGPFDRNIHRGRRLSAARAYLHPAMGRPNLRVETRAFVTRILFEGRRAVGVEYTPRPRAGPPGQGGGGHPLRWGLQLATAPAAVGCRAGGPPWLARRTGRGRRAGRRGASPGPPGGVHPVRQQAARVDAAGAAEVAPALDRLPVALPAPWARAPRTTSRAAASCGATIGWPTPT